MSSESMGLAVRTRINPPRELLRIGSLGAPRALSLPELTRLARRARQTAPPPAKRRRNACVFFFLLFGGPPARLICGT